MFLFRCDRRADQTAFGTLKGLPNRRFWFACTRPRYEIAGLPALKTAGPIGTNVTVAGFGPTLRLAPTIVTSGALLRYAIIN
jgi:hypothetical protein